MAANRRRSTRADVPVLQVVSATTRRAAWRESARGLGAADLAMHVVLPELDGRILAGAVAFKDALPAQERSPSPRWRAVPSLIASRWSPTASRRWSRLRALPRARAPHRGADAGLSRRAGPHRLCGRPRRAGKRARRCSMILRRPVTRSPARRTMPRALLAALAAGAR